MMWVWRWFLQEKGEPRVRNRGEDACRDGWRSKEVGEDSPSTSTTKGKDGLMA